MEKNDLISSLPSIFLFVYGVLLLMLLAKAKKEEKSNTIKSNTIKRFALGSGNYTVGTLVFTILGTMIGPGFSYGAIEQFYQYGIGYTGCFLFVIVQFLLFGRLFAGKLQTISAENPDIVTIGGIIGLKYNKWAQFWVGVASVAFSIGLVATLGYAGGEVLEGFLDINHNVATVFIILFIMIYSFSGGMGALVKTDTINIILISLFLVIGLAAGIILFMDNDVSWEAFWEFGVNTSKNNTPSDGWFNVIIAFLFGEVFIPVYSVRSMMADDEKKSRKAFYWAAFVGACWFIVLTAIAIFAHLLPESAEDSGKLVYLRLIDYVTPDWGIVGAIVKSIAIIGMLSVVVSTIDSILNAGAVSFNKDIVKVCPDICPEWLKKVLVRLRDGLKNIWQFIRKYLIKWKILKEKKEEKEKEKEKEKSHRWAIVGIAGFGCYWALTKTGIVDALLDAYSLWVPAVFCPIAYCFEWKIRNEWTGFCGIIAGSAGWAISAELNIRIPFIPPILQGIIVSAIVMLICECYKKVSAIAMLICECCKKKSIK